MAADKAFLLMSSKRAGKSITRIARQIVEDTRGSSNIILFGINERGNNLARILSGKLEDVFGCTIPYRKLDIRDSATTGKEDPVINITGKQVVIIDDVIFSGKTMFHAFESVLKMGDPEWVRLAALVDRGHRIYPIEAEYVGIICPTKLKEHVSCLFEEGKPSGVWLDEGER